MNKSELRRLFINKQKLLASHERRRKTEQIIRHLFEKFDFSNSLFVNSFITLEKNNELETSEIFQRIWREFPKTTTTAPRVNFETNSLENISISPASKFIENKWGILEPIGNEFIDADKLDACLVPLVAFDEFGFRVGYGKGFYDKFLANCRADCWKIGLSLFPPVKKIANVANFDVRLDYCLTPERVWKF